MKVISIDPGPTRTGVYLFRGRGESFLIQGPEGCDRYYFLEIVRHLVERYAGGTDLALVEDYAYSRVPGGGKDSIEAGTAVRMGLASAKVEMVLLAPAIWKSLTIGNMKKGSAGANLSYCQAVESRYGKHFDTTDEADSFLIYEAVRRIWQEGPRTEAQRRIHEQVRAARDAAKERR